MKDRRVATRSAIDHKLLAKKYKASKHVLQNSKTHRAKRSSKVQKNTALPFESTKKAKRFATTSTDSSLIALPQKLHLQRRDRLR